MDVGRDVFVCGLRKDLALRGIGRVLQIFEFVANNGPVGVSEVARNVELPKSTVHRYLLSLADAGWTRSVGAHESTRWEVTPRALMLSQRGSSEGAIVETAREHMTSLRNKVDETITLQVPNANFETVHIGQVDSTQAVRTFIEMGSPSFITLTSGGMAILANLPPEKVNRALEREIPKRTDETTTDKAAIRAYLPQIRSDGYAVNFGQNRPGVRAVGAAIVDAAGVPVAAIGISIPASRFDVNRISWWGEQVRTAAERIAKRF